MNWKRPLAMVAWLLIWDRPRSAQIGVAVAGNTSHFFLFFYQFCAKMQCSTARTISSHESKTPRWNAESKAPPPVRPLLLHSLLWPPPSCSSWFFLFLFTRFLFSRSRLPPCAATILFVALGALRELREEHRSDRSAQHAASLDSSSLFPSLLIGVFAVCTTGHGCLRDAIYLHLIPHILAYILPTLLLLTTEFLNTILDDWRYI